MGEFSLHFRPIPAALIEILPAFAPLPVHQFPEHVASLFKMNRSRVSRKGNAVVRIVVARDQGHCTQGPANRASSSRS